MKAKSLAQMKIEMIEIEKMNQMNTIGSLFIAVDNVGCINNLTNMDTFLVIIHNLEPASSDVLDLCSKYLIRTLNYTPCPTIISIELLFFLAEQNYITRSSRSIWHFLI
jgi:hypothetical protein